MGAEAELQFPSEPCSDIMSIRSGRSSYSYFFDSLARAEVRGEIRLAFWTSSVALGIAARAIGAYVGPYLPGVAGGAPLPGVAGGAQLVGIKTELDPLWGAVAWGGCTGGLEKPPLGATGTRSLYFCICSFLAETSPI